MSTDFLADARIEMVEAAQFYESRQPGLGDQFLNAIERAVADIEESPRRWPVIAPRVRKRAVGRFPYSLLYRIAGQNILIVAVMHMHRRPRYWMNRLQ